MMIEPAGFWSWMDAYLHTKNREASDCEEVKKYNVSKKDIAAAVKPEHIKTWNVHGLSLALSHFLEPYSIPSMVKKPGFPD